jgi:6-phosphogluconolactonase
MEIRIFDTENDAASACGLYIAQELRTITSRQERTVIALTGGNTFLSVYDTLASQELSWQSIVVLFTDERSVPSSSPESNYGNIKKRLIDRISISGEQVHPISGTNNPAIEALRYTAEIEKLIPVNEGVPTLDLLTLGIGEDGHIASIFPDDIELLESAVYASATRHPVSAQARITLTGTVLLNAALTVLLVTGEHKADALMKLVQKRNASEKFPARRLFEKSRGVICFADRRAFKL